MHGKLSELIKSSIHPQNDMQQQKPYLDKTTMCLWILLKAPMAYEFL